MRWIGIDREVLEVVFEIAQPAIQVTTDVIRFSFDDTPDTGYHPFERVYKRRNFGQ